MFFFSPVTGCLVSYLCLLYVVPISPCLLYSRLLHEPWAKDATDCAPCTPCATVRWMIKAENQSKQLGPNWRSMSKAKTLLNVKGVIYLKSLTCNLPQGAAVGIVFEIIGGFRTTKKAITFNSFMHSNTSCPSPNKRFEQTHANKRLAMGKDFDKLLIPVGIWNRESKW